MLFSFISTGCCFADIGTIGPVEETELSVENSFQGKIIIFIHHTATPCYIIA